MPGLPVRQCHKSCRCSDGSMPTRTALRGESVPEQRNRGAFLTAGTSILRRDEAACLPLCKQRPSRRRASRQCGSARSFGRSEMRNPPLAADLRFHSDNKSTKPHGLGRVFAHELANRRSDRRKRRHSLLLFIGNWVAVVLKENPRMRGKCKSLTLFN